MYPLSLLSRHLSTSSFNLFQYCWQNGGYLVQLESHREEYDLGAYLSETDVYWTGLNDQAMEGSLDI